MNVTRLSPRLRRVDCLILVGDSFHPPAKEARDWIEEWLAQKPGRTVIYFGRDFAAETYVYEKTLANQPADRTSRAEFDLARSQSSLDRELYMEVDDDVFCRWFVLKASLPQREITRFEGPLSRLMGEGATWPVRSYLDVPEPDLREHPPAWRTATMTPAVLAPRANRTAKNSKSKQTSVFGSIWSYADINDDDVWEEEWDKVGQSQVLLSGADGTPLVTEVTNERFSGSRIWLLANGAPLLNGMLVEPHFMELTNHLIGQLEPGGRVAFLPFTRSGIQVSAVPDEEQVAGLSVLVTWPLNILMAHLALLGILICLALFPITGRPQQLPAEAVSDFGQHAEALGQLLSRTRDIQHAAQLSAEYLRVVRGESLPQWLQSASVPPRASSPPETS